VSESARYRLFGSVGSPYALKLRSLLRFRRIPFDWMPASLDWIPEGLDHEPLCARASAEIAGVKPPVVPVLWFPQDGSYQNDSTPVAYELERRHAERPAVPSDPALALCSHLLEDMADEWGVKIAFLYRWGHEEDAAYKSRIVTGELVGAAHPRSALEKCASHFARRQQSRMPLVGANLENQPLIDASFGLILEAFDRLPESSTFLFGEQPTLADFGWYGQVASLATDPTPWRMMRERAPSVFAWLQLMEDASGVPAAPAKATPAARALLAVAGKVYLPFLAANAQAIESGRERFSLEALGHSYEQGVFRYQHKCLKWLREEFASLAPAERARAKALLEPAGCMGRLRS
jgi:glutathione S-transferase